MAGINRIKALLIDLSGTLHIGSEPIPGAIRALQRLREAKFPFRFCSNTSKESTQALIDRLRNAGFDIYPNEVLTSLGAMRKLLKDKGIQRPYLLLSPSAEEDFTEFKANVNGENSHTNYDAVVVGLAPTKFTYEHLNTAFRILSASPDKPSSSQSDPKLPHPAIPLLATHRARFVRSNSGDLSLGPGPFVSALEVAVGDGLKAECIGKPERAFFEVCLNDLGLEWKHYANGSSHPTEEKKRLVEKVAVIGDDIEADLAGGALELGLWRVLVKTGKYREGDESKTVTAPDEVYDSFGAFVDALLAKDHTEND